MKAKLPPPAPEALPKALQDYSDADIQAEIRRREAIKLEARRIKQQARREACGYMTHDIANAIAPEHDRKTCDDKQITNGLYNLTENGLPQCTRCALIDLTEGADMPEDVVIKAYFERE